MKKRDLIRLEELLKIRKEELENDLKESDYSHILSVKDSKESQIQAILVILARL